MRKNKLCFVIILLLSFFINSAFSFALDKNIMIEYEAGDDQNAAATIRDGLTNYYSNVQLRQISASWSDSAFYNVFTDYEIVVVVGGQEANSLFNWLSNTKGVIRNIVESDDSSAVVQEASLTIYAKTFKIFAVASYTAEGTSRSANESLWRFCRDSDFGITYFIRGYTRYIDGSYNHVTSNDRCDYSNPDVLEEFYCVDYNSKNSIQKACSDYDTMYCDGSSLVTKDYFCNSGQCDYSLSSVNCPNGCQNNSCIGCPPPKVPRNGRCEYPCCYNGDLYWCYEGNVQDMKEDCAYGCENNVCNPCPPGKVFRNNRCEYPCCYIGDLYWCYEGNVQDMKEDCQNGCIDNQCINCTSHSSYACYNHDVYWYDSCGNREDLKEDCVAYCEYGVCCIPHSSSYCYNNNIYWRDSCGNTEEIKENCNSQDTYLTGNVCIKDGYGQRQKDVYRLKKDYSCSGGDTSCQYVTYYEKVQSCADTELCIHGQCKPYKASDWVCNEDNASVCHYYGGWSCPESCSSGCDQATTLKGHNYAYCHEDRFDVQQFTMGNNCSGCDETWCSYCQDSNTQADCRWDSNYYSQRWVKENYYCSYGCNSANGICKDTSCQNGVRDYDEGGIDCGGSCDPCETTLSILIIPFDWKGSFEDFERRATEAADYYLDSIPLIDCPSQFKFLKPEKKNYGLFWGDYQCRVSDLFIGDNCFLLGDARVLGRLADCGFDYKLATGKKFDFLAGITDQDIGLGLPFCNYAVGGISSPLFNSVIAEIYYNTSEDIIAIPQVVTHELGHKFNLQDQYCDCSNSWLNSGKCGANVPVSKLREGLGCKAGDGNGCCWGYGSGPYDPPIFNSCGWCIGNYDMRYSLGSGYNHSVMSNRYYGFESGGTYDIYEYSYINRTYSQMRCKNVKGSAESFSKLTETLVYSGSLNLSNFTESILEINLLVDNKDKVTTNNISINFGEPLIEMGFGTNYSLRALDQLNNIVYRKDFDLDFFVFSDPPQPVNETFVYDRIRYNDSLRKIELYHNNSLIFSYNLSFCNNNSICGPNENFYSCPSDCEPWAKDGICRDVRDYKCDADCSENTDPDCFSLMLNIRWNLVSYPVMLNISTASLLQAIDGKYNVIYTYNSSSSPRWKKLNLTDKSASYFDSIDNVKGLWIYMNSNGSLNMSGLPSINTKFFLKGGWNLISYPDLLELGAENAFFNVSSEVNAAYAFENSNWKSYMPSRTINTLTIIEPGMALWVNVKNDTIWVFDKGFKKI